MKRIIESKKTGQQSTITEDTWQSYVRRGIAGNFKTVQRILSDVPVEVAQVVEKMKRKAGKPDNDMGEPEAANPGNDQQNDETE